VILECLTAVKIHVEFLWVVTPCIVIVGYQCFVGPHFFHLLGEAISDGRNGNRYRPVMQVPVFHIAIHFTL